MSEADWMDEIERCVQAIEKPFDSGEHEGENEFGLGIARPHLAGFRTPYLEYNAALFRALSKSGFRYDASIEEGWQRERDGRNYFLPYTLDSGSPGDAYVSAAKFGLSKPVAGKVPGLWELPVYPVIVPSENCARAWHRAGPTSTVATEK